MSAWPELPDDRECVLVRSDGTETPLRATYDNEKLVVWLRWASSLPVRIVVRNRGRDRADELELSREYALDRLREAAIAFAMNDSGRSRASRTMALCAAARAYVEAVRGEE